MKWPVAMPSLAWCKTASACSYSFINRMSDVIKKYMLYVRCLLTHDSNSRGSAAYARFRARALGMSAEVDRRRSLAVAEAGKQSHSLAIKHKLNGEEP